MRYVIHSIFGLMLVSLQINEAYANILAGPDSNSTIHKYIIRNCAPFLYVAGQTQVGDLGYEFDNLTMPNHTSYDVNFTSIGFEVGGGWRYKDLGLFITGGYNFMTYYSGHHAITDTVEDNGVIKTYLNPVITEHKYPRQVLLGSLGLEYRIHLTPVVQCIPFVVAKIWKYPDNRFFPIAGKDDVYFELHDNNSFGGGLSFKGVLPNNSGVALKICLLKNNFNPVGYFDSLEATHLKVSDRSVEISLIYEFDFSGYEIEIFNHRFSFY